jgi:endonuclease/exonuclease/phosphatase family metal-dependent hydrolase
MTHIIKYLKILILPCAVLLACGEPDKQNLDVMTFNIRYENPDDGMFAWDSRKEMVFWLIEKYDPDILGVQEALESQMLELDKALSTYDWTGVGREDGDCRGEYIPVFYRKDRFQIAEEGYFWLSERPEKAGSLGWDAACTRMVNWIGLVDTDKSKYFVFNTHFDHVGEEARIKSAKMLSDSVKSIAGNSPVIILGDFNAPPGSDPLNILTEFFIDARVLGVEKAYESATTFVGFPADLTRSDIIDHIFITRHFNVEKFEIISDNAGGFFPSDHLPVFASLSRKNN